MISVPYVELEKKYEWRFIGILSPHGRLDNAYELVWKERNNQPAADTCLNVLCDIFNVICLMSDIRCKILELRTAIAAGMEAVARSRQGL